MSANFKPKRNAVASRDFLAIARLSCLFYYQRQESYVFAAVCMSVCKISQRLCTDLYDIFKEECLSPRNRSVSSWRSRIRILSWILDHFPGVLPL